MVCPVAAAVPQWKGAFAGGRGVTLAAACKALNWGGGID